MLEGAEPGRRFDLPLGATDVGGARFINANGEVNRLEAGMTHRPLQHGDDLVTGRLRFRFLQAEDLDRHHREELYRLHTLDPATEVYNRPFFTDTLRRMLERNAEPPSLLVLNIDDQLDAPALRELATFIRETLRKLDVLARTSKRQFAVILPQTDGDTASQLAESLRQRVARTDTTVSIRVAVPGPNDDLGSLLA